jgi:hypothetical protein
MSIKVIVLDIQIMTNIEINIVNANRETKSMLYIIFLKYV